MAYNPFPATYNPYGLYGGSYQPAQQTQPQQNGIIWIQGEAAAKSYMIAPNTTVALWDSEAQVIYLKSADASGMPSMRVLDYTIRDAAPAPMSAKAPDYATKADVDALRAQIDALKAQVEEADK